MPGNLSAASSVGVLPQTLCTAFTETRLYPVLTNTYHDGTYQASVITDGVNAASSIKTWSLTKKLTPSNLATLKTFYEGTAVGSLNAWYFYDPFSPASGQRIGSNYDSTGTSTQGRYTCRFTNQAWEETTGMQRTVVSISFQEVA